jgi:glucosyl-dolichyl phosphate glucuronosyltransferase
MLFSVAICTYNRAALLEQTLAQMEHLRSPGSAGWELIVVDNNCRDGTPDVLRRFAGRLPLRSLQETAQGQSHARNCATRAARGRWIIWTDDDVLVDPDWLAAYADGMAAHGDGVFFGGTISPFFAERPPEWLQRAWPHVSGAYAVRECDQRQRALDADFLPFGANFMVRGDVQQQYVYRTDIGRIGDGQLRGDELDVVRRILAAGGKGYWLPQARVQHIIPSERLTLPWLRAYYRGAGMTAEQLEHGAPRGRRLATWRLWQRAISSELEFRWLRLAGGPERWIRKMARAQYLWGRLEQRRAA